MSAQVRTHTHTHTHTYTHAHTHTCLIKTKFNDDNKKLLGLIQNMTELESKKICIHRSDTFDGFSNAHFIYSIIAVVIV